MDKELEAIVNTLMDCVDVFKAGARPNDHEGHEACVLVTLRLLYQAVDAAGKEFCTRLLQLEKYSTIKDAMLQMQALKMEFNAENN